MLFADQPCGTVVNVAPAPQEARNLSRCFSLQPQPMATFTSAFRTAPPLRPSRCRMRCPSLGALAGGLISGSRNDPMESASHAYVYYRVTGDDAAARRVVARLLGAVEGRPGAREAARALRRRLDLMEVYEPIDDARVLTRTLAALAREHGADAIAVGDGCHVECFAPLSMRFRRAIDARSARYRSASAIRW